MVGRIPVKENRLAGLKFKKKTAHSPTPSVHNPPNGVLKSVAEAGESSRSRSRSQDNDMAPTRRSRDDPSTTRVKTPQPTSGLPRPKPIPAKGKLTPASSSMDVIPAPKSGPPTLGTPAPKPAIAPFPYMSPLGNASTPKVATKTSSTFPVPSPLHRSSNAEASSYKVNDKKSSARTAVFKREDSPIEVTSSGRLPAKAEAKPAQAKKSKVKRAVAAIKRIESEPEEDADDEVVRAAKTIKNADIQPFPMSTQLLATIGLATQVSSALEGIGESSKRGGSELSDDSRASKRRRSDGALVLDDLDEGYSVFYDPSVDPDTLCPYCDEPLPTSPSPLLLRLLEQTKRCSYTDKRPTNPKGRKAPLANFIVVCQRHGFESKLLPTAKAKGWPQAIKFEGLRKRIEALRSMLQDIIDDPGQGEVLTEDEGELMGGYGPRGDSIFWREIKREIKKKGARAVAGVAGQFANFEKTQPGYYGELGSVIIHQTLYTMFPPADLDPNTTVPLNPNEFIQRVLVPEVAASLIMDDMDVSKPEAVQTLRDSAQYGVAMFPDTHNDGSEGVAAGDKIVKERAKKRRKELEAEETIGDRIWDEKQKAKTDGKGKGKAKAKAAPGGDTEESGVSDARSSRPAPRPRPTTKKREKDDLATDTADESGASDTPSFPSQQQGKPRPKPLKKSGTGTSTIMNVDVSEPPTGRSRTKRKSNSSKKGGGGHSTTLVEPVRKRTKTGVLSSDDDNDDFEIPLPPPKLLKASQERSSRASSRVPASDGGEVQVVLDHFDLTGSDDDGEPALPPRKPLGKRKLTKEPSESGIDAVEIVEERRMTRSRSRALNTDDESDGGHNRDGDATIRMDVESTPRPVVANKKRSAKGKAKANIAAPPLRSPSVAIVDDDDDDPPILPPPSRGSKKRINRQDTDTRMTDANDSDSAAMGAGPNLYAHGSWLKDSSPPARGVTPTEVFDNRKDSENEEVLGEDWVLSD